MTTRAINDAGKSLSRGNLKPLAALQLRRGESPALLAAEAGRMQRTRIPLGESLSSPVATGESGMALVSVMLIMSLMLMLGLAVTFTSLSDNSITSNFKNSAKGFYAAEAGIHNLHRVLYSDQFIQAALPNPAVVTPGQATLTQDNFTISAEKLLDTKEVLPNDASYRTTIKILNMSVPFPANDNNPADVGNRVALVNPQDPKMGQLEPYSVTYELDAVGEGIDGLNGTVKLAEQGVINFELMAAENGAPMRAGSFAEFALYTDHFDPYNPPGGFTFQGLGPGDRFSGRVHTNERFGFWSNATGQDSPVFSGLVTQADPTAAFYRYGAQQAPPPVDSNSEVVDGVLVAPQFEAGFERGVQPIPPVANSFNQARAVLDGGFSLSSAAPTDAELDQTLRPANALGAALPAPKDPTSIVPDFPPGIYIPTDGEAFTGSGIYVMGDASQIQLSADPTADRQIIRITQGGRTVTVVVDVTAGTTTIDAGNGTQTLKGIPMDRSLTGGTGPRPAASIYVRGNVNSLTGPGRDSSGQPMPAVDSTFALTVTAGGYTPANSTGVTGGNVTITGDLTYETPVVDPVGNPINQTAANLLGVFASGGNIEVPIDGRAPNNLTVDASLAAFAMKDANGNAVVGPNGQPYGGRIRSDINNWQNDGNLGNFTVVGGMQSSTYDNFGVYTGSMHGYSYQGLWDARYDKNHAPPFYPGYLVNQGAPTNKPVVTIQKNSPMVLSYKRIYYGTLPQTQ